MNGRVRRTASALPELTVRDAHAVQAELRARETADGAALVGLKIGATSEAIQRMFGIDQPDFGYLTDRTMLTDGSSVDARRFIAPTSTPGRSSSPAPSPSRPAHRSRPPSAGSARCP
ncbi:hypothetical protein ACIPYS_20650 [Kitasatospora sp. NPDC089913]|uniref:hypothetical protein n=1 Tax=Kitasatospora sp. NPDC089913 TaxID=3364080 RepID=UPI003818957F